MHEQLKICEAEYFFVQMSTITDDRDAFNHNLSALLSAARSVLQYAHKEAMTRPGGEAWYVAQVSARPVIKFFKDKRDVNIHENPVSPSANIVACVNEAIHLSDSFTATIIRGDGSIERKASPVTPRNSPPPTKNESSAVHSYFFSDWSGMESVPELCRLYLDDLKSVVSDGVTNGFLTPPE